MEKFLAKLHQKSDYQKKQFALLASGTITLFIFGVWSLSTFGVNETVIATKDGVQNVPQSTKSEIGPLQSLRSNLASAIEALKSNFGEIKHSFETINVETEYTEMRDGALNIYGQ
ncbi:MAG: hypothetical protein Q7S48_01250 [bacterium]|nr:hypothetical protein [bacterium]